MRVLPAGLLLFAVACDGCGGAGAASGELPAALDELAQRGEIVPFDAWTVEGLELYRVSWAVPDRSTSKVVAVDENGALVEGRALMERVGELPPGDLATRAFGVLMGRAGATALSPGDDHQFATEQQWSIVTDPRLQHGAVVFYSFQGEMSPTLVEHRLDASTFSMATTMVDELLLARGDVVVINTPTCVAIAPCGCWSGCVRAELVRMPEGQPGTHRLLDGENAGTFLAAQEECLEDRCFQVCRIDSPTADCDAGALTHVDLACSESCPPSEAPYHCEILEDSCRQVDHPIRAAAFDG